MIAFQFPASTVQLVFVKR